MSLLQAFLANSLSPAGAAGERYRLGPTAKWWLHMAATALFLLSLTYVGLFAARNWHEIESLPRLQPGHLALADPVGVPRWRA